MDEDTYLNLLSMHIPLTKKNVTLVGQTITPHERVSAILRFLATGRSYEDLKFSIISPQTLRYIISETCDTLYKSLKILTLSLLKLLWYGHFFIFIELHKKITVLLTVLVFKLSVSILFRNLEYKKCYLIFFIFLFKEIFSWIKVYYFFKNLVL